VQSPGANGGVSSVNQGLSVVFDRPIESSSDFENAVSIQPKTEYTVSHRNQQLNITFEQNLLSNTEYVLSINPLLEDDLGRQMKSEYTYEFSTAEPSFSYLERNYEPGAADKIIQDAPLSGESRVLFGADKIKLFGRSANYLAVVLPRADSTDEVRVVDLETVEERTLDIPSNMRIDNLKFSPADNQFVFAARAIPTIDTSESSSEASGNTLYRYDIDSDQLQPIADMGEGGEVDTVLYSSDGQALLYQTLDREYYLTGAAQNIEPILLGKYGPTGGFDRTNNKLTFISGANAIIYDAQAKEEREVRNIQLGGRITTPIFLHNSDELIYLREPIGVKKLQVYTADADGNLEEQEVETQPLAQFFDEPVVSYDDRYILIQATFEPQGDDRYIGHSKPKDARLVLFDRFDNRVIDPGTIHGIDPVWTR